MKKLSEATAEAYSVRDEVMEAYCDCREKDFEACIDRRNLRFRAAESLSRDDAAYLLAKAVPQGYNEFSASLLAHLPENSRVTIAREGSVALYVTPAVPEALREKLRCDEFHTVGNETRLWWD